MRALLLSEHHDGVLSVDTAKAVMAFVALDMPLDVLVLGSETNAVAAECARIEGVSTVICLDGDEFNARDAGTFTDAILSIAQDYTMLAACASRIGKDTMPRVAAALDVMQISEVVEILPSGAFRRPVHAGALIQTVTSGDPVRVLTIRAGSFVAAAKNGKARIEHRSAPEVCANQDVQHVPALYFGPELQSAAAVVAGGRGLGSKERFDDLLLPLAEKLVAAIGASRAAVDSGYAPNECQVGQTGKSISPDLYVACGISGAVQHLTGIRDAKVVVAINSDPEAPIFQFATYGLVGDLSNIIPELTRKISEPVQS